ncbi:glycosyltransferase family 2 protein [Paenibacillus sp. F411]|uniref:glycosyltransferase family 2 protein n=1 Tax=Paenibacillus sp. F411 TaxID=2820239 RepID=UPI001AB00D49|nr:glycosyltransferase family 2 protein [Paenibacillus sp. F411]MBO2944780.1 glycosyltransferase family 2 protein [Paenibacillus sp. F411]
MRTLVIIPAYNEEGNLGTLLQKLSHHNVDVIVINDCSTDRTVKVCIEHNVKYIDLPNNLGIGGAVQTGYQFAAKNNYDIAIQIDGDGQHNPEYIPHVIKPLVEDQADMVIGSRYITMEGFQSSFVRRVGIKHFSRLIKLLLNQVVTDPTSGFRACNKSVIELFSKTYPTDFPEPETIVTLIRTKQRVVEVPVVMNSREMGISSINKAKAAYYMVKVSLAILIDYFRVTNKEIVEST